MMKAIDSNPDSIKYQFHEETFRISKMTELKSFIRIITDYWGLDPPGKYFLYDDNGEVINFSFTLDKMDDPIFQTPDNKYYMDKIMETVMRKDFYNKDLFPAGPRKFVLYLGDGEFGGLYNKWIDAKRVIYENEK